MNFALIRDHVFFYRLQVYLVAYQLEQSSSGLSPSTNPAWVTLPGEQLSYSSRHSSQVH